MARALESGRCALHGGIAHGLQSFIGETQSIVEVNGNFTETLIMNTTDQGITSICRHRKDRFRLLDLLPRKPFLVIFRSKCGRRSILTRLRSWAALL